MKKPLRVIDLGEGPRIGYATRLLAGFGAEVIKIERPGTGDSTRSSGPFPNDKLDRENSGLALFLDAGKRSVCIDQDSDDGIKTLSQLLDTADLVFDEISQQQAIRLGLDEESMDANYPQLIRASISPFGMNGPNCDLEAPTLMLEALCGWLALSGEPGQTPARIRGELASAVIPGSYAVIGALAALNWREEHGEGQFIEISAQEAMISASRFYETTYAQRGIEIPRLGSMLHPTYGYMQARDGYVALCAATGEQQEMLPILADMAEYIGDPLFQLVQDGSADSSPAKPLFYGWIADHDRKDIFKKAQELRVPAGYLSNANDVLTLPQLIARGALTPQKTPDSEITFPGPPFRMSEMSHMTGKAPLLGEHTREILSNDTKLSNDEIEDLYKRGVLA